jgi:hypothetical protein
MLFPSASMPHPHTRRSAHKNERNHNRPRPRELDGFSYSQQAIEKVTRDWFTDNALLDSRGDLFVWAFLRSEVLGRVARVNFEVQERFSAAIEHARADRDLESRWLDLSRSFPMIEVEAPSTHVLTLRVRLGQWPDDRDAVIDFALGKGSGVVAKCEGFPGDRPTIHAIELAPRDQADAQKIAVDAIEHAIRLLRTVQGPLEPTLPS